MKTFMHDYEPVIEAMKRAGAAILAAYPTSTVIHTKETTHQVVTEADFTSEALIVRALKERFPSHGIIAEEQRAHHQPEAEFVWHVDPLDGTRNFASRIPLFGINAALVHAGTVIFGATYLPMTDEICTAALGQGTLLNGFRVYCSNQKSWRYSVGIGPIGLGEQSIKMFSVLQSLSDGTAWVNSIGCPAASGVYVASGRRDWYAVRSKEAKTWDWAAPSILMKEAGCLVTNADGEDWNITHREMIAANATLHPAIIQALQAR